MTLDQLGRFPTLRAPELAALVRKHWGVTRGRRAKSGSRRSADSTTTCGPPPATPRGTPALPRPLRHLPSPHGEGETIGPDLTYANRQDRDFLLVSLVDPAGVVRKEYQAYHIATKDGRVLSGLIVEQTPEAITLRDAKGERTRVVRSEIEELKESDTR